MITIYHNPRCSKSREGLGILKDSEVEFQVRDYIKEPPSKEELQDVLDKLHKVPIEIIRTDEKIWKENYKGRDLNDEELIEIMIKHPKLIQRPIVVSDKEGVVGRPPERIKNLLIK